MRRKERYRNGSFKAWELEIFQKEWRSLVWSLLMNGRDTVMGTDRTIKKTKSNNLKLGNKIIYYDSLSDEESRHGYGLERSFGGAL